MTACAKLLRFLADGSARRDVLAGAPAGSGDMLLRGDGARLLTNALREATSDGLVSDGETVTLRPEGHAWLQRHEACADPFSQQHQRREVSTVRNDGLLRPVVVDRNASALSRLAHGKAGDGRAWVDRDGLEAGERLARDFEIGRLRQRVTSSWDPSPRAPRRGAGGGADLSDRALDARARLDRALAVLGRDLSGVVLDICCFDKGTSQVERERHWPPRSAKLMLRTGLALLARHYGVRSGPV